METTEVKSEKPLEIKQEIECGESSIAREPTPEPSTDSSSNSGDSEDDEDDDADSNSGESDGEDEEDGKLCTLAEKAVKFTCEDCGRNYSTSGYLRKHRESCNKPSYHPCHLCEKVLTTGQELRYHLNEHNGEKPYVCRQTEGCGEAFHHPRYRMMHEQRCGGGLEQQEPVEQDEVVVDGMVLLMCKRCGKLCKTPGLYRRHQRNCLAKKSCHMCQKEFKSVQSLQYHLNWHTGDKPYKCQVGCEKLFSNPHHRRKHEKMCGPVVVRDEAAEQESDATKRYACDQCSRKYGAMGHLLRHKKACHNEGPAEGFVCPVCKMEFKNSTRMRYHLYEHTGEKPFKCYNEACSEAFTTPNRRHEHGAVCKHGTAALQDLRCDVCQMALKTAASLRIHKRTHAEHQFVCHTCGAGFHLEFKLRNHMKKHEEEDKPAEEAAKKIKLEPGEEHKEVVEPIPLTTITETSCHQCKRKFKSETSIQRHLKFCVKTCHLCPAKFHSAKELSHHLDMHNGTLNVECRKSCGRKFYETRDRNEHEKVCGTSESETQSTDKSSAKNHTCDHCGKSYLNIGYLLRHKRLCNNSEPVTSNVLQCPECPKTFTTTNSLRYHLNEHTGETPYACRIKDCKAAFANLNARKWHERQCAGSVKCSICEKMLKNAECLKEHMKHRHAAPQIECPDCGKMCATRSYLTLHQKRKHQPKAEPGAAELETTISVKEEPIQSDTEDEEIVGI